MPITIPRGTSDEVLEQMIAVLEQYQVDHPQAQIDLYRRNSASVRVRIIDSDFAPLGLAKRHERVWQYLEKLPEDAQGDISSLILLAPSETSGSLANMEFQDPSPSLL